MRALLITLLICLAGCSARVRLNSDSGLRAARIAIQVAANEYQAHLIASGKDHVESMEDIRAFLHELDLFIREGGDWDTIITVGEAAHSRFEADTMARGDLTPEEKRVRIFRSQSLLDMVKMLREEMNHVESP